MFWWLLLAASLLVEGPNDVAHAAHSSKPRGETLATSSAGYAKQLHKWFRKEIRLPDPHPPGEILVSPRNLCTASGVQVHRQEDTWIIVGRLAIAALPSGLRVVKGNEARGEYRLTAVGYVIPRKGGPIWAGEVTMPGVATARAARKTSVRFSVTVREPARGASLLLVVAGRPLTFGRAAPGGPVILGYCVRGL